MTTTWQHFSSFPETNLHMLEHGILCDFTFLAGNTKAEVKCHKFILASRNPVFHTMFCGSLPEKSPTIEVPDIDATTLRHMLQFLYTGEVELSSDTVVSLMYVANKYDIHQLQENCVAFLETNMASENVCTILEQAILFDEKELQQQCLKYISRNTRQILNSDEFLLLSKSTLAVVLDVENISCQETDMYDACKRWAANMCTINNIDPSDEQNIRNSLGDLIFLIRFPAMDPQIFCNQVAHEFLLSPEEKNGIYCDLITRSTKSSFKSKRRCPKQMYIERFFEAAGNWNYTGKQDGISFRVSKSSTLLAVGLYLPNTDWHTTGPLDIFANEEKVSEEEVTLKYQPDAKFEYMQLQNKLPLIPGTTYSLRARFTGAPTYRGIGDKGKQTLEGFSIEFLNLTVGKSDNSTCVAAGQFHGLLIELNKRYIDMII